MSFYIGNVLIKNPFILAPMAGITSTTFRSICKSMGASLVVGEMVSDKALIYKSKKTYDLLKMQEDERPISQQIFGSDEKSLAKAAKIVEDYMHPDIIDINMGCPVTKVAIKSGAGSALLKDLEKIKKIVSNVVKNVSVPVTVKIRSGWDEKHINAVEVAKICEEAGASAIFIHARTKKQGYSGNANWNIIKEVVKSVSIPVIGNGDIKNAEDALRMMKETGCQGVMIARASLGNPWIFKQCLEIMNTGKIKTIIKNNDIIDMMKDNIIKLVQEKGEKIGVLELRTQLMYYLKKLPKTKEIKLKINKAQSQDELLNIISQYQRSIND